jgi:signal transduction histidine kinase
LNINQIHVLLIEDNHEDARFIQETLLEVVTPIFTFNHVDRLNMALQALAWEQPDVVLLDLSLPDTQGLETFTQVQAIAPDSPILILTGIDDERLAISAMQLGAQDYLIKGSLEGDMLVRSIRYSIERLVDRTQQQTQVVQRILETVNVGILTLNASREIVVANPVAIEYLKLLTPTRIGETLTKLGDSPIDEMLRPQTDPLPYEIVLEGEEEKVFEVHVSSFPLGQDEEGWTLLLRDVTEVRQIQVLTEEQDRQAAVGQLASGIAHDFNNISGSIILYCEMLMNKPEIKGIDRERLATIMHQAQRAAALTRQILDFSSTGLIEPHRMDLVPFMDQISKLLRRTLPESIRLSLLQKEQFHVVDADPVRLQQVFLNLAVNARDAMPKGGELRIELENIYLQQEKPHGTGMLGSGNWVRITFSDTSLLQRIQAMVPG